MGKIVDIAGQKFGRLSVVALNPMQKKYRFWECLCDCGETTLTTTSALTSGMTKSCGCLRRESAANAKRTHGKRHTRLYRVWAGMRNRCLNQNTPKYKNYGGRGITIYLEWTNFERFALWAETSGYTDNLTIDRIDNDKGYSPDNCQWITLSENSKKDKIKLTNYDVGQIRHLCKEKIPRKDVATNFNVCLGTIDRIMAGRIYVNL